MNQQKLLNKLYNKQLTSYQLARKENKSLTTDFFYFVKSQSVQQCAKQIFIPIKLILSISISTKNSNDGMYFLFTAININRRYVFAYYRKKKKSNNITFSLNLKTILQKNK